MTADAATHHTPGTTEAADTTSADTANPDTAHADTASTPTDPNGTHASGSGAEHARSSDADGEPASQGETQPNGEEPDTGTPSKRKPRKQSTARKSRSVELTLTVTGTADGEWQADLVHGTSRVVRGLSIPAASVSRAARELHTDISGAIEQVLETAREQHRSRVEELQSELEKAQRALAELEE